MTEKQIQRKIETLERRVAKLEQRIQKIWRGSVHTTPKKQTSPRKPTQSIWARELYEMFVPVRNEAAKYSEAEVNADIDAAIAAVRSKRA